MRDEHIPVLVNEVLEALDVEPAGRYVDATYGRGGHSAAILKQLGPSGRLLVIDRDPAAIAAALGRHGDDQRVIVRRGDFQDVASITTEAGMGGALDGVLFDLGVSSPQLDDPARGFSFASDGPLDMRMNPDRGESAAEWLARIDERRLADAIFRFGEERRSRAVARAIVARREQRPFTRTADLAHVVAGVVGRTRGGIHPATRTFQALRIVVNDELGQIERALGAVVPLLAPGGRLAVISFHSLEDRIVKRFFRSKSRVAEPWRGLPVIPPEAQPELTSVNRAIRPGNDEIATNPRARSARLRVAQKVASS